MGKLDLDRALPLADVARCVPQLRLPRAELSERRGELTRPRPAGVRPPAQRLFEPGSRRESTHERLAKTLPETQQPRIGFPRLRRMWLRRDPLHLGRKRTPPRLELEPDRFCRLTREPELAPRGVPTEALGRDRRNLGAQQRVLRHDG